MILSESPRIEFYNMDCMEYMKSCKDKQFDLAIVDPPYGINASSLTMGSGKNKRYTKKDWDKMPPSIEYFNMLFKVSDNQIICGGNYFTDKLPISKGWIFWDKGVNGDCSFADGELLWTSYDIVLRKANVRYKGFLGADIERIHITQKPIKMYRWLLTNYAKAGETILDTHVGSASSLIACHQMGFNAVGCELDKDYYDKAVERFKLVTSQTSLF